MPPAGDTAEERAVLWQSAVLSVLVEAKAVEAVLVMSAWITIGLKMPRNSPHRTPGRYDALILMHVSREKEEVPLAEINRNGGPPQMDWNPPWAPESPLSISGRVIEAIRRGLSEL
jgi:hypothetical protein